MYTTASIKNFIQLKRGTLFVVERHSIRSSESRVSYTRIDSRYRGPLRSSRSASRRTAIISNPGPNPSGRYRGLQHVRNVPCEHTSSCLISALLYQAALRPKSQKLYSSKVAIRTIRDASTGGITYALVSAQGRSGQGRQPRTELDGRGQDLRIICAVQFELNHRRMFSYYFVSVRDRVVMPEV